MARVVLPTNDEARLAMLKRAMAQSHQDAADGITRFTEDVQSHLEEFVYVYQEALQGKISMRTTKRGAEKALRDALEQLKYEVRDLVQTTRREVQRKRAPVKLLDALGLPHSGPANLPTSHADWLARGAQLHRKVEEITDPELAGLGDSMALISADSAAQAAAVQLYHADAAYQQRQKGCAALRVQANRLCRRVAYELRQALWQETPSARRRIMRRYGIRFDNDAEESTPEGAQVSNEPGSSVQESSEQEAVSYEAAMQNAPSVSLPAEPEVLQWKSRK